MCVKKYLKKPVVVSAIQWTGKNQDEINHFVDNNTLHWAHNDATESCGVTSPSTDLYIMTLEGMMHASPGDYIIRGIKGEFYPCKPDIFFGLYDIMN